MSEDQIYFGSRDEDFKKFIENTLRFGTNLNDDHIKTLIKKENLVCFEMCFTHSSVNLDNNYEFFEILGDGTVNKSVIWYLQRKYPELKCAGGVKYLSRLKIILVSRKTLSSFAEKLGFWDYISALESLRNLRKNQLLEDTFEAFIGCLEFLLDKEFKIHVGYGVAYKFLSKLLDDTEIPAFNYEDLWDAKSRLKELFDFMSNQSLKYVSIKEQKDERYIFVSYVKAEFEHEGEKVVLTLGNGSSSTKLGSEQEAAQASLDFLKSQGIIKKVKNNLNGTVIS